MEPTGPMASRRFAATLQSLGPLRTFVKEAAAACGLEPKAAYGLMLAVDEIATNIVTHGFQEAGLTGDFTVHCQVDSGRLRIVLEDEAAAFDPRSRDLPTQEELARPLEDRSAGGLGIFLTVQGVDRFDYQRREGRNVNIFELVLPSGT
jgi:anti-sigma regulatory factor (Ser/Thr protein kinase)